jgi:hypothetical protein
MTDARANMDADIDAQDVAGLVSADALAGFFQRLGYDTSRRAALAAEAIGISDADGAFRRLELISEDPEGLLRVVLAQVRSVTAKARNDLVRALGGSPRDHSIVLTSSNPVPEAVLQANVGPTDKQIIRKYTHISDRIARESMQQLAAAKVKVATDVVIDGKNLPASEAGTTQK